MPLDQKNVIQPQKQDQCKGYQIQRLTQMRRENRLNATCTTLAHNETTMASSKKKTFLSVVSKSKSKQKQTETAIRGSYRTFFGQSLGQYNQSQLLYSQKLMNTKVGLVHSNRRENHKDILTLRSKINSLILDQSIFEDRKKKIDKRSHLWEKGSPINKLMVYL